MDHIAMTTTTDRVTFTERSSFRLLRERMRSTERRIEVLRRKWFVSGVIKRPVEEGGGGGGTREGIFEVFFFENEFSSGRFAAGKLKNRYFHAFACKI